MNGRGFSGQTRQIQTICDLAPLARAWGSLAHPDQSLLDFRISGAPPKAPLKGEIIPWFLSLPQYYCYSKTRLQSSVGYWMQHVGKAFHCNSSLQVGRQYVSCQNICRNRIYHICLQPLPIPWQLFYDAFAKKITFP